jgi:peptide/nickel transport system ATP-binding protein
MTPMQPLLSVTNLSVEFETERGTVRAVDDLSFDIHAGESLGIVGESGSGKSVTSLAILGLISSPPGRIVSGSIKFCGQELVNMPQREFRKLRGRDITMIFQDPMTALDPVFTVGQQMSDVIRQHMGLSRKDALQRATEMLDIVGIPSAKKRVHEYPHQLSGGMRQRVMIAMALSCNPKLLLADEPTTALDVTTQAQVLDEIRRLQEKFEMAVMLVTHDLGVIRENCTRVLVMYCGKAVETTQTEELFRHARHPYTHGLLESIPQIREVKLARLPTIPGMVPDLVRLPQGCRFAERCFRVQPLCRENQPPLMPLGSSHATSYFPLPEER